MATCTNRKCLNDILNVVEENGFYYNGKYHKNEEKFIEEENNKWLDLRIKNTNAKNTDIILSSWIQNSIAFSVNFAKNYLLMNVLIKPLNDEIRSGIKEHIERMNMSETVSKSTKYGVAFNEIKNAQIYLLENSHEEKYISRRMYQYFEQERNQLKKKVGSFSKNNKIDRYLDIITGYVTALNKKHCEESILHERYEIANHILETSKVINYSKIAAKPNKVVPGTIVKYQGNGIVDEIELTGIFEGDIGKNVISAYSGFGIALLDRPINEEFIYAGARMKILDINNAKAKRRRKK